MKKYLVLIVIGMMFIAVNLTGCGSDANIASLAPDTLINRKGK